MTVKNAVEDSSSLLAPTSGWSQPLVTRAPDTFGHSHTHGECTHAHTYTSIHTDTHTHSYTYIHTDTHTHTCTGRQGGIHACTHTHIQTDTHAHTHACIHTCTHTYTHK